MYLERVEIQGFKSFANKAALEFRHGITAIVGPNGSGKSNVADAIRWVLGEQSLKLIRGKRAEDVIFAGSDQKTKLGTAEVSLTLNNEDGKAPIDFSELVITRRVYRDGTGEYLINKRTVRLQDIQMLLARSNFGQRTYSVIGQGMVDAILMTGPQERKHFFDEAAGVRQFQLKREQTISKLDRTRENLRQAEALLQEIEPRLRSLTRQVRRLERRSEVERQLVGLQTLYYRGLLQHLRQELSGAQTRFQQLETGRQKHEASVTKLNAELSTLEREQTRSEAFAALQQQFERWQNDKSVLLAEQAVLDGQRQVAFSQHGQGNVVWLEKQSLSVGQQGKSLDAEIKHLEQSATAEKERWSKFQVQEKEYERRFADLEKALMSAGESVRAGAMTWPDVQREFASIQAAEQSLVAEIRNARTIDDLAGLRRQMEQLDRLINRLGTRLSRIGSAAGPEKLTALQEEMHKAIAERDQFRQQASEAQIAVRLTTEKLVVLRAQRERVREEHDRLERELARSRAASQADMDSTLKEQAEALRQKIGRIDEQLEKVTSEIQRFNASETSKRQALFRLQRDLRVAQDELNAATASVNDVRVEVAKLETRLLDVDREIREEVKLEAWPDIFDSQEKAPLPTPEKNEEIQRVKNQLALIGGIDESVEREYKETDERYTFLKTQYDDLTKASKQLEEGIAELDRTIKERFDEAFDKINQEFGKFFQMLFRGGSAKLILLKEEVMEEATDEEEEEDEGDEEVRDKGDKVMRGTGEKVIIGIDIHATPPGKRLKGVAMLSGGERALTSIALICAIISNNPMPFAVLDEVDAALDEANSQRFADILEKLAHKTQFVTITHNRATMEKANILYGVTMGDDGVSKLLSVKLEEAEGVIKKFGNR